MTSTTRDSTPDPDIPGNRRYALVITLQRVEPAFYTGWDGTSKEVTKDKAAITSLLQRANYEVADLSNQMATRDNVVDALDALASATRLGGEVVIYFSGHGATLPDRNKDERGFLRDGAWCLHDGMFVDDELTEALIKFNEGVRVVVISESCFAGPFVGEDRDRVQRSRWELVDDERGSKLAPMDIGERVYEVQTEFYDKILTRRARSRDDVKAGTIFLSACGRNELARVDKERGSEFTHAIVDEWGNGTAQLTYNQLFGRVKEKVTGRVRFQTPVMTPAGNQDPPLGNQIAFGGLADDDESRGGGGTGPGPMSEPLFPPSSMAAASGPGSTEYRDPGVT